MYKTVFIYYKVLEVMSRDVKDVKRFVDIVNNKNSSLPFYHCYGIWFNGSACRFCPFFIDVDSEYVAGLCRGSCADVYVMRYLK